MSKRTMRSMLAVSIVAGLVVAISLYRMATSKSVAEANAPLSVVIARTAIQRGTILTSADVATMTLVRSKMAPGSFTAVQSVAGRIVKDEIPKGAPILESSLVPSDRAPLLGEMVPPGYRAIGLFVDGRGDMARFIRARDHVDVVVTMDDEDGTPSSKILLQDVVVLAVPDATTAAVQGTTRVDSVPVTVAVTPADGEKLSLAMRIGTIQLLVRGQDDGRQALTSGVTQDTLLPQSANQNEAPTTYRTVEIIRGQDRVRERFRQAPQSATPGGAS